MNTKSTDVATTASFHTHHAPQLELQAVAGAIRLRRRAGSLEGLGSESIEDVIPTRDIKIF